MGATVRTGGITLPVDSALAPYLRVKVSGGVLAVANATETWLGVLEQRVVSGDTVGAVKPKHSGGTTKFVAGEAVTQYANVYGYAGGKVGVTVNENFIGVALTAASGDGSELEVLELVEGEDLDQLGPIAGNVVIDDDFLGDYPDAATAFDLTQPWIKVETNGLGVTESDEANGVLKFAFDAVAEAATAALYMPAIPFDIDKKPIFECRLAVFDKGGDAALDINFGLASGTHATDFDAIQESVAFHLDGNDLSVKCQSDDNVNAVAAVDTTVDLVDDTYADFKIDCSDKSDIKFYINGTRVLSGTTFHLNGYSGRLTPIVHVEKTSNDTTADVRVDRIRVQAQRN